MPTVEDYSKFLTGFSSAKFQKLWPAQEYVLAKYSHDFVGRSDVAIELPTGAGKTLIALLVAEAWRRQEKAVAILSANKTLARQMEMEAQQLGIPAVRMEGAGRQLLPRDRRDYNRARKIGVMNYWVYFNQNPVVDPADFLVMDDAHLAEHCLHSLWSVDINRHKHKDLFDALILELARNFPEYTVLTDALEDTPLATTTPELLSFIDQARIADRLREIIDGSPLLEADTDLKFRWNRLRNCLNETNIYLSLNSIWIRPYIYPLINNKHYRNADQRMYMSATIGEPSDLCRRLGTQTIEKIPVPPNYSEATCGRRLIVINRTDEEDIPERLQVAILTALRKCPKSLWLCTSGAEAEELRQFVIEFLNKNGLTGHQTWLLTSLGDEIDQFKKAKKGHLFAAGRFDGMDFQGNECRLVVLVTLPHAINTQEEFLCGYLRDAGFMKRRLNQRIIQALGRCNRSEDDYAVYVLADKRFSTHFGRESNREGIPKNIMAEIDMAEDMVGEDASVLEEEVRRFSGGDFSSFDATFRERFSEVPGSREFAPQTGMAGNEVLAWAAMFSSQNYNIAAKEFESCWQMALRENIIELGAYYGWCWAKARYLESLHGGRAARDAALSILEKAIDRGGKSAWFNRMRVSLNRERAQSERSAAIVAEEYSHAVVRSFDNLLEELGKHGTRFEKWCNRLSEELQSSHHDQYRAGINRLGTLLGYNSRRPRHNVATDCHWRATFGNRKEVITFEAKIQDVPSGKITATDMGQVHNQIERTKKEYEPLGYTVRGTIVSHLSELLPDAESSAGEVRVIPKDCVLELWTLVRGLLTDYRSSWSLDRIDQRRQAAEAMRPKLPQSGWLLRALETDNRFLTTEILVEEWKKMKHPLSL